MYTIHWSPQAQRKLLHTLTFWHAHTRSEGYGQKILHALDRELRRLQLFPYIGAEVIFEGLIVRRLVILRRFSLYFLVRGGRIEVVSFRDNSEASR